MLFRRLLAGHRHLRGIEAGRRRRSFVRAEVFEPRFELLQLAGVAGERFPGVGGGSGRLIRLAEDLVGAHQPYPGVRVGAVFFQTRGQAIDHAADHVGLLFRRLLAGHRQLRGIEAGRRCRRLTFDACERGAHLAHPMRTGRRIGNKIAPDLGSLVALSILLGGDAEIVAGADCGAVERDRAHERRLGGVGHDAVCFRHQGLAEIGFALGIFAKKLQNFTPGIYGIGVTAELQINRRQDLPAAAIIRISLQVRLDLGHHDFDRSLPTG